TFGWLLWILFRGRRCILIYQKQGLSWDRGMTGPMRETHLNCGCVGTLSWSLLRSPWVTESDQRGRLNEMPFTAVWELVPQTKQLKRATGIYSSQINLWACRKIPMTLEPR